MLIAFMITTIYVGMSVTRLNHNMQTVSYSEDS